MATVGLSAPAFDAKKLPSAMPVRPKNSRLAAKTPHTSTHELTASDTKVWPKCGHGDQAIAEMLSKMIAGAT